MVVGFCLAAFPLVIATAAAAAAEAALDPASADLALCPVALDTAAANAVRASATVVALAWLVAPTVPACGRGRSDLSLGSGVCRIPHLCRNNG